MADWFSYLSIVADAITLVAVAPLAYRYLRAWWSPHSVQFYIAPGAEGHAQAGGVTRVLLTIENRTSDVAFFQIGTRQTVEPGMHPAIGFSAYQNYPKSEQISGQVEVGPLGKQRVEVDLVPRRRGDYAPTLEVSEFFHGDTYPNWLAFRRRVLRMSNPTIRPLVYARTYRLHVASWQRAPQDLPMLGQLPMTPQESALDSEFDEKPAG